MTSAPYFRTVLRLGALVALAVGIAGAVIGMIVAGVPGVLGAVAGAGGAAVFLALTAASLLLAGRVAQGDPTSPAFFAVVLGGWMLKLIVFLALAVALRGQPWLDPFVFFGTVIAAVIGSLVVDVVAFQRSRIPYVDRDPEALSPGSVAGDTDAT